MQRSCTLQVLAFAAVAAWSVPASAHAGGAEAAPLVGGVAGFIAGVFIGAIPNTWRKNAIFITFALLLSPIFYLIFKEPGFPTTLGAAFAGWLALGFAYFLVPAALLGLAGYSCASWVKRAVQFNRKHGRHTEAKSG